MPSGASPPLPAVSAVIINWNTRDHLIECLESLNAREPGTDVEIIVVDNNSPDGSADEVERRYPSSGSFATSGNLMFAGGATRGWPSPAENIL